MKVRINVLSITVLIGVLSAKLYASDITPQKYVFNDFDRNTFTNYQTHEVELVYSTPLIESVSNEEITVTRWELESLLYPALTRITYKRRCQVLRHCNSHDGFVQTAEQKEQVEKYWERESRHSEHLQKVYEKAKIIESLLEGKESDIVLFASNLMLLVQYAAYKVEHYEMQSIINTSPDGTLRTFLYGDAKKLLEKYRSHEQK